MSAKSLLEDGRLSDLRRGRWTRAEDREVMRKLWVASWVDGEKVEPDADAVSEADISPEGLARWMREDEPSVMRMGSVSKTFSMAAGEVGAWLELVAETAPVYLWHALEAHVGDRARGAELVRRFAEPMLAATEIMPRQFRGAVATVLQAAVAAEDSGQGWAHEVMVDYIRRWAKEGFGDRVEPYLSKRFWAIAEHVPEIYTELAVACIGAATADDARKLGIRTGALDTPQLERILEAAREAPDLYPQVCEQVAMSGEPAAAAEALAGELEAGGVFADTAAMWLTFLGEPGRLAARKTDGELAGQIAAIPAARRVLFNYYFSSSPVQFFHADRMRLGDDLESGEPTFEPIEADAVVKTLSGSRRRGALEAHEWIDLLHVVNAGEITLWDTPATAEKVARDAHQMALGAGKLGRGVELASLRDAIDDFDFSNTSIAIGDDSNGPSFGLMHFLLAADAPEEALWHAIGALHRVELSSPEKETHFTEPIEAWAGDELAYLDIYAQGAGKPGSGKFGPEPVLAEVEDAGTVWEWEEPITEFRLVCELHGASRWSLTMRDGHEVSGEVLPGPDPFELVVQATGGVVEVGSAGIRTERTDVAPEAGTLGFETDAERVDIVLQDAWERDLSMHLTSVVQFGARDKIGELVDRPTPEVAQLLAGIAAFHPEEVVREDALSAVASFGDVGQPFVEALAAEPVEPKGFEVRPFEDAIEPIRDRGLLLELEDIEDGRPKEMSRRARVDLDWTHGIDGSAVYLQEGDRGEVYITSADALADVFVPEKVLHDEETTFAGTIADGDNWRLIIIRELKSFHTDEPIYTNVALGAWRVDEGVAVAIWSGERALLAEVIGLPAWPAQDRWDTDIKLAWG
jgi:hypothetical protein